MYRVLLLAAHRPACAGGGFVLDQWCPGAEPVVVEAAGHAYHHLCPPIDGFSGALQHRRSPLYPRR